MPSPKTGPKPKPVEGLFWSKVNKTKSCWLWTGKTNNAGYGIFANSHHATTAHRWSYVLTCSKIQDRLVIDHLCRNKLCVRPDHLEAVTQQVNLLRGLNTPATRTACPKGHHYSIENTSFERYPIGITGKIKNGRKCKICRREKSNAYYQRCRQERLAYAAQYRSLHRRRAL